MRLGTDPEVFLQDVNGNPISSIGYIRADKWNPLQIPNMPLGFTLQEDNVSLEYGVPPASSPEEFIANIQQVMEKSKEYVPGLSFSRLSCIVFPKEQLEHPMARIFGCEPDYSAWTKDTNPKPNAVDPDLRSAGGHIHVETTEDPFKVGRAMDLFVGVPSVLMDIGKDSDKRKLLYGKHGAIRPKPYGVEYRVLSNFWIFEDSLIRWAWNSTERALSNVSLDLEPLHARIAEAIDNNNKVVAQQLVDEFQMELV